MVQVPTTKFSVSFCNLVSTCSAHFSILILFFIVFTLVRRHRRRRRCLFLARQFLISH